MSKRHNGANARRSRSQVRPAPFLDTMDSNIEPRLDQRLVLSFWLPLASSWLMMDIANPIVNAGIARLPNAAVSLAAFGIANDMAALLESPIIMILSTSVALVHSGASLRLVRRFMTYLLLGTTLVGAIVYFTPAFDLLFVRLLGVPSDIAAAAQPAMQVLIFWPIAVGWRRFYQGILIQHGHARLVAAGTVLRLATLLTTVTTGVWLGIVPGALLGGLALTFSVILEAVVVVWWGVPVARLQVWTREEVKDRPARIRTQEQLLRFYLPLAATDVLRMISRPIAIAGIAHSPVPELSLAAWPVAFSLASFAGSAGVAFQEVTVALLRGKVSYLLLRRCAAAIGLLVAGLLALVLFTPLEHVYFSLISGLPPQVEELAVSASRVMFILPLVYAGRSLYRGSLIQSHLTSDVRTAMIVNVMTLTGLLALGVWTGWLPGVLLAASAFIIAHVIELILLHRKADGVILGGEFGLSPV